MLMITTTKNTKGEKVLLKKKIKVYTWRVEFKNKPTKNAAGFLVQQCHHRSFK